MMKKIFSLLALSLLVISFTNAQVQKITPQSPVSEAEDTGDGPNMVLATLEIDYGVIKQGSDPLRTFVFTNEGNEPLQITNAKGSCGCTVPSYPKMPIFPGEDGVIEVRYDTKRIGKFVKRVTLTTNEKIEKRVLTIKGEVLKPAAEPDGIPASAPGLLVPNGGK